MDETAETFTCARCGGMFEKGRSGEEAEADARSLWTPETMAAPQVTICDPCFTEFVAWAKVKVPEALQGPRGIEVFDMVLPESYTGPFWAPFRDGGLTSPLPAKCYRMASGAMVHVKPECRCPR